ncbi:GLPGLI family protein [Flavobacterium dankookense]|uniref:GLPGLI family protein n=1 Tax=Flavobacterium dankookense TaxID=706186 RepID=A0A4R6QHG9_9FLAO|nr:GLPGLI family protein [Flavobacterium dankookense]TDP61936.1 GLPGLI family protein [Flavobacterium dankookense]
MKKILLLIILFFNNTSHSQKTTPEENKITKVIYKSNLYDDNSEQSNKNTELRNSIANAHNAFEYVLYFDKNKSLFSMVDVIDTDESLETKITRQLVNDSYFKDNFKKEKIKQNTSLEKIVNIILPFEEYKWSISNETKIIDGYTCYKASCIYQEYDENRKKMLTFTPFVWFAPSLPHSFGPAGLDGLPGLVLEGTFNGRLYFYATKINLNDNTIKKIDKFNNGEYVTEEEYQKIEKEYYNKLNDGR